MFRGKEKWRGKLDQSVAVAVDGCLHLMMEGSWVSTVHLVFLDGLALTFKLHASAVTIFGSTAQSATMKVNPLKSKPLRLLLRAHLH